MPSLPEQKPGCLTAILLLFRRSQAARPEALPYRLRDDFLSSTEFSFYKVLSSMVGPRLVVLTKVRLADIFFVARPNENVSYLNRIAQRHVDFLLCNSTTMKPVIGIELDDSSHDQARQRERDTFLDQVFQAARLPILRQPVQREYNTREIAARLVQLIENGQSPSNAAPQNERREGSAPLCPKCGIPMLLRTASQGEHKGQQFYGCQNYPRCREVHKSPA